MDGPICKNINDPLLKDVVKYQNHASIAAIKKVYDFKSHFSFKNAEKEEILKELNCLNINRATQNTDITTKIIKENSNISGDFTLSNLIGCINTSLYPLLLRMTDITPVHKKDLKSAKNNYTPASILSNNSKVYKRIIFKQMLECFEGLLSKDH